MNNRIIYWCKSEKSSYKNYIFCQILTAKWESMNKIQYENKIKEKVKSKNIKTENKKKKSFNEICESNRICAHRYIDALCDCD